MSLKCFRCMSTFPFHLTMNSPFITLVSDTKCLLSCPCLRLWGLFFILPFFLLLHLLRSLELPSPVGLASHVIALASALFSKSSVGLEPWWGSWGPRSGPCLCFHPQLSPLLLLQPHTCSPKSLDLPTGATAALLPSWDTWKWGRLYSSYQNDWQLLPAISGWNQSWQISCSVWESLLDVDVSYLELRVAILLRNRIMLCHAFVLCICHALCLRCSSLTFSLLGELLHIEFQLENDTLSLKPPVPPFTLRFVVSPTLFLGCLCLQWTYFECVFPAEELAFFSLVLPVSSTEWQTGSTQ